MLIKLINEFWNWIAINTDKAKEISRRIVTDVKRKNDTEMVVIDFSWINVIIYDFIRQLLIPLKGEKVKYQLININDRIKDKIESIESEFKKP